jgi:hypothetical protein
MLCSSEGVQKNIENENAMECKCRWEIMDENVSDAGKYAVS